MSYRYYIGELPREVYNKFSKFTFEDYKKYYEFSEDYSYKPMYEITNELYGFGNDFPLDVSEIRKNNKQTFRDEKLYEAFFYENGAATINKIQLKEIIESYIEKIKSFYKDLTKPIIDDETFLKTKKVDFDVNTKSINRSYDFSLLDKQQLDALFNMILHFESKYIEWNKLDVINFNDKSYLTDSWRYEYAIFDLVRIYKIFDWDNKIMILYGY